MHDASNKQTDDSYYSLSPVQIIHLSSIPPMQKYQKYLHMCIWQEKFLSVRLLISTLEKPRKIQQKREENVTGQFNLFHSSLDMFLIFNFFSSHMQRDHPLWVFLSPFLNGSSGCILITVSWSPWNFLCKNSKWSRLLIKYGILKNQTHSNLVGSWHGPPVSWA